MSPELLKDSKQKILIVDDSPINRSLLRSILKHGGYAVDELENGRECLAYCKDSPPSMILLDVMMPEIDGIQACKKLRESHSKSALPIIMVTTLSETEGLALSLEAGANDYIMKPVDRATLLARMQNQLALSSAQRQIEEQAKVLANTTHILTSMGDILPEAIAIHDASGQLVYSNRTFRQFCSNRAETDMGMLLKQIFGGKFKEDLASLYAAIRVDSKTEFTELLSDSRAPYRDVFLLSKPIPLANEVLRLWFWRDETATRELERSLHQRVKLDAVGLFAAGVAHNFNNLMGAITGAADVLERNSDVSERSKKCFSLIRRSIDSGARLTRKMAAVYHRDIADVGEDGSDVIAIIQELIACYKVTCGSCVEFELSLPGGLPRVRAPERVLVEVIGNVVTNAIEAIADSGKVQIGLLPAVDNRIVKLVIQDSGCGIDEATLDRLYEPFFSTKNFDKLSNVSVEGRGLGLWNTYNLLQACGGGIEVNSSKGSGTKVIISLPVA